MNVQLKFVILVFLATPFVWKLSKPWGEKVMMLTTLATLLWIAPHSACMMLAIATVQWLLWKDAFLSTRSWRLIAAIGLPGLLLVTYKLGGQFAAWGVPLGLSYFIFRQIHVAFECYKGYARPSLKDYFQYLLFLPVMLVGPIHRMPEMQRSLRRRRWEADSFSKGLERILYGMTKITFLGNYLFSHKMARLAAEASSPTLHVYLHMMSMTGNAYMQFAGFSDLAIGASLLWGIRIMENFNHPFLATNMQDFWRRWHISLSNWCRDYIFQPMAAFSRSRWLALTTSMLVLALWHEISFRYIFWGVYHMLLILIAVNCRERLPLFSKFINDHPIGRWLGRIWVTHVFAFSTLLVRAGTFQELFIQLKQLFGYV